MHDAGIHAPGYRWRCVDHLQEYGPETLDIAMGDLGGRS